MAVADRNLQDEMWSAVAAEVRSYNVGSGGLLVEASNVMESAGSRIASVEEVNGFGEGSRSQTLVAASHWPWVEVPS